MNGLFTKVIMWVVGILVLFSILAETLGDIITANTELAAVTGLPAIIATIADFWWIGVVMLLIATVMQTQIGKRMVRSFRGRRRRK